MKIAVISGASSGMGREFVYALDRQQKFDEIWVIARRVERLEALRPRLRAGLRVMALDLQQRESILQYQHALEQAKPDIAVQVNAAGFGVFGAFREMPLQDVMNMVDLNARALTAMTHATLPYMKGGSQIYNLGSMSSFQPVPYMTVYGASKAFVLSFSCAMNVELKKQGVHVMAVCPGWIKTEFFDRAVRDNTVSYYNRYYTARQVVDQALEDMAKGKDVSVLGAPERRQVFLVKHLPHKMVMDTWCRQQKLDH